MTDLNGSQTIYSRVYSIGLCSGFTLDSLNRCLLCLNYIHAYVSSQIICSIEQTGIYRARQTGSCLYFLSEISIRSHLSSWKPPYDAGTVMLRLTAAKRAFMNSPHAARHDGAAWSLFCSTYYSQHVHSPWTGNINTTRLHTSCTHAVNGYVGWSEDAGEMISL